MASNNTWKGYITVKRKGDEPYTVQNAILDGGLTLTGQLWTGQTTEKFAQLQIEDGGGNSVAKDVTSTSVVDQGALTVTSVALFSTSDVSFAVTTVALIGSEGTRIAEAAVNIPAGNAVEITRQDVLSEV